MHRVLSVEDELTFCIKKYSDADQYVEHWAVFSSEFLSPWQIPRVLFAVANAQLYHKPSSKWPEEMWTSCQFWEHSEGRNSHNIAHNFSITMTKRFHLRLWHEVSVLQRMERQSMKRTFLMKNAIFGTVSRIIIKPLPKGQLRSPIWGAGDREFAWWGSNR